MYSSVGYNLAGIDLGDITDGTSNTLAFGEASSKTSTNRGTFWAYTYTSYSLSSMYLSSAQLREQITAIEKSLWAPARA